MFIYQNVNDSPVGGGDTIKDFDGENDIINISNLASSLNIVPSFTGSKNEGTWNSNTKILQLDIDGDTSTNDTVVIMSNGMSGITLSSDKELNEFQEALNYLTKFLAKQIAEDGEGISHLITVEVNGAKNDKDALSVSNAVVSSSLVKTAIFGKDPNWGRIMMAIGNADAEIERDKIRIFVNGIQISEEGKSISFHYQL